VEQDRFDDLARSLAGGTSRRQLLRALTGGAAAGLFALTRGGRGTGAQSAGTGLGGICTSTSECVQQQLCGVSGSVVCADNGIASDGQLNCCLNEEGLCGADFHCCGNLVCFGGDDRGGDGCPSGRCRPKSASGFQPGTTCTITNDCDQAAGPTICANNGIAPDGALNCCREAGGACSSGSGCCGSLLCTGACVVGPRVARRG